MLLYNAENIVTLDTLMTFVNLCSLVRNLEFIVTISQLKTFDNVGFYALVLILGFLGHWSALVFL